MKVLVAPNSMKGSLNAFDFADAIEAGFSEAGISDVVKLPLADGGDGTANVLAALYKNPKFCISDVCDPLGRIIKSGFFIDKNGTAIIEMADASGLKLLVPAEYSAMDTSSFGTGQLIKAAIDAGAKTIVVGLGGSATVDCGMGALLALGVKFFGKNGEINEGTGRNAGSVVSIDATDASALLKDVCILFLSDVETPLIGQEGAARIFGPQKGATSSDVEILDENLSHFASVLFQTTGKDVLKLKGGGAAGGIAASFHSLFNTKIENGAQYIIEKANLLKYATCCDIIVTGEGRIDNSTFKGKLPGEILKIGTEIDKPVYAICGSMDLYVDHGFNDVICLVAYTSDEKKAIACAKEIVKKSSFELAGKLLKNYERELH